MADSVCWVFQTMRTTSHRTPRSGCRDASLTPRAPTRPSERCRLSAISSITAPGDLSPRRLSTSLQEQRILNQDIDQYQKIVECPTSDAKFPSPRPSVMYSTPTKFREVAVAEVEDEENKELYRRWICLIEPYWTGEPMENDADGEFERQQHELVEDLLLKQEMSEAECDWDRNECY
ncbi:hypothetical protein JTE90_013309 [Oedothorax gibbosus]|uniref:Uncharacterized protein n=1 Tax=Oedothorax gibbosus TaxID=931172 RepID=A0AAV6VEY1_9ARAC|nr:hypothetical protein JTE90_013309 [Oedothorax gibbosus]